MLDGVSLNKKLAKDAYKQIMAIYSEQLNAIQLASREAGLPVFIVFEAWHMAGKGRVIRSLTKALDPYNYRLYPIHPNPTLEEKYPWMWRFWNKVPERGKWVIMDGSWYSRIMADRMHSRIPERDWRRAYRDIVDFERALFEDGYLIVKFFLHINKQVQRKRLDKLANASSRNRKVTAVEWEQNRNFEAWLRAYQEAFDRTDTEWAEWTIVEATNLRYARVKVRKTLIDTLANLLDLSISPIDIDQDFEYLQLDRDEKVDADAFGNEIQQAKAVSQFEPVVEENGEPPLVVDENAVESPENPSGTVSGGQ
jgi:polyphosphate kinase 2 (PPK2 family)